MSADIAKILVVDDDRLKRLTLEEQLSKLGYRVISKDSAFAALQSLEEDGEIGIVLTDLKMTAMSGLALLKRVKTERPQIDVIVMTAYGSVETAVEAIKGGAYDYIQKPFIVEELALKLDRLLERRRTFEEIGNLRSRLAERYQFHHLVFSSKRMREISERAQGVADESVPVLIQGETGAGKEVLAQAIHYHSARRDKPFVALSCAMLNPSLLESELFGHDAGAFTGALKQKRGKLELAGAGTLFLDDADDIPFDLQAKFLRVLQERKYERVGGEQTLAFQARIIAATKKDLRQLAKEGRFRDDLMYRLDVVKVDLPPLRDRREDIPVLMDHFKEKYGLTRDFAIEALRILLNHDWPGNVRELENVVQQVRAVGGDGPITTAELPSYLSRKTHGRPYDLCFNGQESVDLPALLGDIEQAAIEWAMIKAGGNQSRAAEILNLPRTTLRRAITETEPPRP